MAGAFRGKEFALTAVLGLCQGSAVPRTNERSRGFYWAAAGAWDSFSNERGLLWVPLSRFLLALTNSSAVDDHQQEEQHGRSYRGPKEGARAPRGIRRFGRASIRTLQRSGRQHARAANGSIGGLHAIEGINLLWPVALHLPGDIALLVRRGFAQFLYGCLKDDVARRTVDLEQLPWHNGERIMLGNVVEEMQHGKAGSIPLGIRNDVHEMRDGVAVSGHDGISIVWITLPEHGEILWRQSIRRAGDWRLRIGLREYARREQGEKQIQNRSAGKPSVCSNH